jgi:hypothetical protein
METQALAASDLTTVGRLVHLPLTLRRLTPLIRLILTMMKTTRNAVKKVKMRKEASWRSTQLFLVLHDKGGEKRLKLQGISSVFFLFYLEILEHLVCQIGWFDFGRQNSSIPFSFFDSSGLENKM